MIILIPTFLIISQTVKYPPALPWIVSLEILAIFITIWIIIKIHWLKKFNIEQKDIYQLARIIQTYRSWILKENYMNYMITKSVPVKKRQNAEDVWAGGLPA